MNQPPKEQITLNFKGDDVRLFALLRQQARKNRRTITAEILCRIERTLENQEEV